MGRAHVLAGDDRGRLWRFTANASPEQVGPAGPQAVAAIEVCGSATGSGDAALVAFAPSASGAVKASVRAATRAPTKLHSFGIEDALFNVGRPSTQAAALSPLLEKRPGVSEIPGLNCSAQPLVPPRIVAGDELRAAANSAQSGDSEVVTIRASAPQAGIFASLMSIGSAAEGGGEGVTAAVETLSRTQGSSRVGEAGGGQPPPAESTTVCLLHGLSSCTPKLIPLREAGADHPGPLVAQPRLVAVSPRPQEGEASFVAICGKRDGREVVRVLSIVGPANNEQSHIAVREVAREDLEPGEIVRGLFFSDARTLLVALSAATTCERDKSTGAGGASEDGVASTGAFFFAPRLTYGFWIAALAWSAPGQDASIAASGEAEQGSDARASRGEKAMLAALDKWGAELVSRLERIDSRLAAHDERLAKIEAVLERSSQV